MKLSLNINKLFFLLLVTLFSCGQTFNSNTNDKGLVALGDCVGSTDFCTAQGIIQTRCINCHTGYHDQWATFNDEAAWKASGRVVAGSTSQSSLITRLKNQGGNMPADAPQIPDSEYQALIQWVQNMP